MAKLRRFVCYRRRERPYTRYSKFKSKNYVRSRPVSRIVLFDLGDLQKKFDTTLDLIAKGGRMQLRDTALESARQTCNWLLEKNLGKEYHLQIRIYPHHVLRENPLASGAGADRMSTGMAHSFGKSIGLAAQIADNQTLFRLHVSHENIDIARKALKRAGHKFSCKCGVVVLEDKKKKPKAKKAE
jgi:large subunit ribosomal protein L10e